MMGGLEGNAGEASSHIDTPGGAGRTAPSRDDLQLEPVKDPGQAIVDSHQHFFVHPHAAGVGPYDPADLVADMDEGHRIAATVYVECGAHYRSDGPDHLRCVGETEYAEAVAEKYKARRLCAAIVAAADLLIGERVDEVFDAHRRASPSRFRGIRLFTASDPEVPLRLAQPADLMADTRFRAGFSRLARHDLSFDAWCFHHQLSELAKLAWTYPDIPIVLDHIGTPIGIGSYANRAAEVFDDWRRGIADLARCPNVHVKLGGLNMPMLRFDWGRGAPGSKELASAHRDYILAAIDAFSPARSMFESNFPVDGRVCSYRVLWNAFKVIAEQFTPAERNDMFFDAAARFYRLEGQIGG